MDSPTLFVTVPNVTNATFGFRKRKTSKNEQPRLAVQSCSASLGAHRAFVEYTHG